MSRTIALLTLVLAVAVMTTNASGQTESKFSRVGTLSCTTGELPPESVADAELSCKFDAVTGRSEQFTGLIARQGMADLPPGKRVLIWSVLATKDEIDPRSLSGRYIGETGGRPPGQMVGGEGNAIVLQPITPESQFGDAQVPTVLSLRLEPLKA